MNTIIVYTSLTGNTELMAESIAHELTRLGEKVELKDAFNTGVVELKDYDRILVGSYTWGDGDLSDEIMDFYDELQNVDLTGKMAAAFGAGDSYYEHFAGAVDILEETLKNQGCEIGTESLKIDINTDEDIQGKCKFFVGKLTKAPQLAGKA